MRVLPFGYTINRSHSVVTYVSIFVNVQVTAEISKIWFGDNLTLSI